MNAEELFLETVRDLERRLESGRTEYDLLMVSFLLRKLLLDGFADAANRVVRLKLRFVPNDYPVLRLPASAGMTLWALQDGFDPEAADIKRPIEVTRDGLLARVVMIVLGEDVTVKDAIRYLAHKAGGVHLGNPETLAEQRLAEIERTMRLVGYPPVTRTMLAIGRVVVRGLDPLRAALQTSPH